MLKQTILNTAAASVILISAAFVSGGISDVISAIGKGNSRELAVHMADNIELSLPDKEGLYSKSQAEQIMNSFFRSYPPQSFKITHQSGGNDAFFIGHYDFGKGAYRVTGFFKNTASGVRVHSLKFEKP